MENAMTLQEKVNSMRKAALDAAMRNINLHVFAGRASSARVTEYVAERLRIRPTVLRLWLVSEGVPEAYVDDMLEILNEHSVWRRHQLFPSERLAKRYMEAPDYA